MSEFLGISVIGVLLTWTGKLVLIDQKLNPAAFITYMGLAYGFNTSKSNQKASYSIKNAAAERVLENLDSENSIKQEANAEKN